LIYVLIVISFTVAIALLINENATNNYEATYDLYFHNQSYIYAISSLEIIKNFFEIDDDSYDSQLDLWTNIPPINVENSIINVTITPANIKINLNLLAQEGDTNTTVRILMPLKQYFKKKTLTI